MPTSAEASLAVERAYIRQNDPARDHQDETVSERLEREWGERERTGAPRAGPVLKYDAGKAPVWRGVLSYFPRALQAISRVSEFGAIKYSWGAWAKVETPDREDRYADALARHFTEMGKDGMYSADPETTHLHLAHLAWNALALLELYARKLEDEKKLS